MAILKCNVCGGELDVNADFSVGVCKFCDSVITIPKELDRKGNLYNRAIFLRQNNEFDKAVATYEDILKEDNSDAEAHWGLVLSKFGIEYVLDPKTQERVPTCHRTQKQSILSDPDYLAAIEHSDIEAHRVIENEAKRISEIQNKIFEISQKEQPYDIFICYKETDEAGNRTEDSVLAQEIYHELKKKGYRIFFARKSLESKLGAEYEPIIFAALNSAKVMIVLGTKAEHFNAVWVKNEWSRFIKMSKDANKIIIPAYRGMTPYELPAELSALQSQDMSKIGFMQDLIDGIERCLRNEANKKETANSSEISKLERLHQNCATYLKLGNYSSAEEVYRTITKEYPEDYRGWWGLIVSKTNNFTNIIREQNLLNEWFMYVKQLSSPEEYTELENKYVEYIKGFSQLEADDDMQKIKSLISKNRSEIEKYKREIEVALSFIEHYEEQRSYRKRPLQHGITEAEQELSAYYRKRTLWKQSLIKGAIALAISGIYFKVEDIKYRTSYDYEMSNITTILALLCFILIIAGIYWIGTGSVCLLDELVEKRKYKQKELTLIKEIDSKKSQLRNEDQHYDDEIALDRKKICECENKISTLDDLIVNCKKYLELGQDKISELWFSQECKKIGVIKPFDSQIKEKRDRALGISKNTVDDSKIDGSKIDDSKIDDSKIDDSKIIVCPACDQEFIISNEAFELGHGNCPNCGLEIKFKNRQ